MQCGEVELEKKIEEKIEQFICWVEKHPNKKSQVSALLVDYHVPCVNAAAWGKKLLILVSRFCSDELYLFACSIFSQNT